MTFSTQHKTSYVNLGLHVAQNNQVFEEEKELFTTRHPSCGGAMWKVLMTMIDTHRKTTGEAHDELPFVIRHGYARHGYTINTQEHVWTLIEEVEGFFELCDILAQTEHHQEEGQLRE